MKLQTGRLIGSLLLCTIPLAAEDFRHGQPAQAQRDAALYVPELTRWRSRNPANCASSSSGL
jgi:hypothetical protein